MDSGIIRSLPTRKVPRAPRIEFSTVEPPKRRSWMLQTTGLASSTGALKEELQVGIAPSLEVLSLYIDELTCLTPQGRGILLDYARWAASQTPAISYSCFSTHSISFSALRAMCRDFKVTPRKGDVLFIRTGLIPEWTAFSEQQKTDYAAQTEPKHAGVEACIETLEWLWDSGISAVAGDAISWEVCAPKSLKNPFALL